MKKIIALLLAVACCVGMVGCNKNDRDASKLDIDASIDINFSGDSDFSSKESVKVVDFPAEVKENTFNVFSAESINTSHSNELYATITCKAETDLDDGIYTSKNVKVFVNDKERKCDVLSYLEVNGSKIIVQYNVDCGYSPKDSKIEIVVKDFNYLNKTATDEDGVVNASDVSNKVAYEGGIKIQVDVAMTFGNAMVNLADYGLGDATLTVSTNAVSISNSQNVF
ncbi:MAG: hypothetical protein GX896_07980, partial [Clostridiales bacterium]|nr:hypothetical protein [Clostridiales bacterium]